jgi:hypothetical protein
LEQFQASFFCLRPELFRCFLAAFAEKILQDCSAFFLQNAGGDFASVIQRRDL